ncbi:MAG: histidinol dehydrogenase, partial [Aromatoleum sp.]|nr:histidinol dehydrogenase [Aromatoleum sp.]
MNAPDASLTNRLTIRRLDSAAPQFAAELAALAAFESAQDSGVDVAVAAIISDVRARGDAAVLDWTAKFDRLSAPSVAALEITAAEMRVAFDSLPSAQRSALETAAARIRAFHERQKQASWSFRDPDGSEFGQRVTPLDRVGVYVPG